jgi:hypothetical protein
MMKAQIAHEITELSVLQCHTSEHRVELVEGMTDLIDGVMLIPRQVSALIDSIFFEEIANLVPRLKEVIITDMVVITRREFGQRVIFKAELI